VTLPASARPTDADALGWIARIRRGDSRAFEAMFRAYYNALVVYGTRIVRSTDIAEELVQEVFGRIWERRAKWEATGSLAAYLHGAVRNEALVRLRRDQLERE
jgi:RNA polymerase sigma-70 factor (ECF subfamily)